MWGEKLLKRRQQIRKRIKNSKPALAYTILRHDSRHPVFISDDAYSAVRSTQLVQFTSLRI
jgi:hypothetical protein